MAPPVPLLAVRGSLGTSLFCGPKCEPHAAFQTDAVPSRSLCFSRDGALFAWCNAKGVHVVKTSDGSKVMTLDLPKAVLLEFSPQNNILATWQPYTNTIANKLHMQKVSDYSLSPGNQPSKVAVYVPGSKGAPSFVRLYQYPVLGGPTAALANKSFFKADKVDMKWNRKASAVLVTASTDVDKTGASYYGEQTLHFLSVSGETALVQLPTVYNLSCEPVFDFGTGPRNAAYYSPQGHILVLAGFGNLRGQMEVWDVKKYKQVCKPQAPDSTHFSWSPDGEHVVTATCSPRLRVSNGFKVWHYSGAVLHQWDAEGAELWEVRWQDAPYGRFPERPITTQTTPTELGSTQAPPTQAYRPPALRHLPPSASSKLHEDEPPQNMKNPEKSLSKTALKNQRKREAKKAAKQKLKAIDELKEQQASGKVLQKNQVEKLQKEAQLLKELEQLTLA
ncbi:hypothetical protein WMY93_033420 [Mugilogobius chulae]|uniref:Eukaryotic translation initiation factor 2A n=1 Tax=Mugilogobius chulae TaxID=88201 RepID=A0AAW0MIT0_9GOBI